MSGFLIVNFGGPRDLVEIPEFLTSLLTDEDVIWTGWPSFLQKWLFRRIALTRAKTLAHDYTKIGGKSPIFAETENIAKEVGSLIKKRVLTFHRYLPQTHKNFMQEIESLEEEKIIVFPMFPQFSYATTGSIARWMKKYLSPKTHSKLLWIRSYCSHPLFVACQKEIIADFLRLNNLPPGKTLLFFSMHGLPQCFVCLGDPYEQECLKSYTALAAEFPGYQTTFAFQSKFGPGQWLRPYTEEACHELQSENVVFVPLSFTSDHIETLFEIEEQYLPILRKRGFNAYRCPALNQQKSWIDAVAKISAEQELFQNDSLIRTTSKRRLCENKCRNLAHIPKFSACLIAFVILNLFFLTTVLEAFDFDKTVNKEKFIAYLQKYSDPSSWMMKKISSELSLFPSEAFSYENLPIVMEDNLCSIEAKENQLQFIGSEKFCKFRQGILLGALQYFAKTVKLPDVFTIIDLGDAGGARIIPICCFAKRKETRAILMPDFEAIHGHNDSGKKAREGSSLYPWEMKQNLLFWRGSTTGGIFRFDDWHNFPRSRIVQYSQQYPEIIDAYFTQIVQAEERLLFFLVKSRYYSSSVSVMDSIKYKYLIDIDGNSCTYSRNYWILLSNSVLFKQQTDQIQWYYDLLIPWVHYVPVASDISDVIEKINWAKQHDAEAKIIAENGSRLAEQELCIEANLVYFYLLLCEIAKLQNTPLA